MGVVTGDSIYVFCFSCDLRVQLKTVEIYCGQDGMGWDGMESCGDGSKRLYMFYFLL